MTLFEVPEQYKMFKFKLSNGECYIVDGNVKKAILDPRATFIELKNGNGFNKSYIVNWNLDAEATKENVLKNKDKLVNV